VCAPHASGVRGVHYVYVWYVCKTSSAYVRTHTHAYIHQNFKGVDAWKKKKKTVSKHASGEYTHTCVHGHVHVSTHPGIHRYNSSRTYTQKHIHAHMHTYIRKYLTWKNGRPLSGLAPAADTRWKCMQPCSRSTCAALTTCCLCACAHTYMYECM
jgi:hypothetical protein